MGCGSFRFGAFTLDTNNRQLRREDEILELNARYFDALALLVRESGQLVSKDRFLDEVWRGVPVTDEALTQCIKTLRRQLEDDAAKPSFIATVPKHGYRFIAPVTSIDDRGGVAVPRSAAPSPSQRFVRIGAAGTLGGGIAGLIGGIAYGFAGASEPLQPGVGAFSILLVLVVLTTAVALIGAAGVAFGIAATEFAPSPRWTPTIAAGTLGGLIVGAIVKFLGVDAFSLLIGHSPGDFTGPTEGAVIGAAAGLGTCLATLAGRVSLRWGVLAAALTGGAAGVLIALLGGRLMGGSLELVARRFPASLLRFDRIGALFGEIGLGPVSQMVTAGLEGALFAGCIAGAMTIARKQLR